MKTLAVLGATAAAVSTATPGDATQLLYTLYGIDTNGKVENSRWYMDSNPLVADYLNGAYFEVDDLQGSFNYGTDFHADIDNLTFYHLGAYVAGFSTVFDYQGIVDFNGPQLYTGPESAPTMLTGTFNVHDYYSNASFTLNAAAVPEPASWALLMAGFGLIGCTLRARRTTLRYADAATA